MRRRSTRIRPIDPDDPDLSVLDEAASILRTGGLVAFPTETVYGLGADATNAGAVAGIFEAKGRPANNPLIVHVSDAAMARSCVADWPGVAQRLADRFWPGPLTMVLPSDPSIADLVTAGGPTVGVRVPWSKVARGLIERAGLPVAAPSANRSNGVSPTTAGHVFDDLDGLVDLILDGGPTTVGLESTVVDLTTRRPRILRPGPYTVGELEHVLGSVHAHEIGSKPPDRLLSPGQLPTHYAPRTPAFRVESAGDVASIAGLGRTALLVVGPHEFESIPDGWIRLALPTPEAAAKGLYATLRVIDSGSFERLVIVPPPEQQEWHAIRDRIWRATRPLS